MKILKLTFENINSYEGIVEIDFTDPDFKKGDNQFVICGPMGAGKSTILDAITLALYGSTARLGQLQKNDEALELINKRSGYCKSEVIYSCSKGTFKSTFYMHKANKKINGAIQQPQCSVVEITDGEPGRNILSAAASKGFAELTTKIIGLNYEQFIRCILIPQGEFAEFLKSNRRDKANILAKLSHTEHYKRAGKILKDEERNCNENYKNLKTERDAIPVLDKEQRELDEKELKALEDNAGNLDEVQKSLGNKISLLEHLQEINITLSEAEKEKKVVDSQAEEYCKKQGELEKARKAADCSIEYNRLNDCLKSQADVEKKKNEEDNKLREASETQKPAEDKAKQLRDEYEKKRADEEVHKRLWSKVRELDVRIKGTKTAEEEKKKASDKAEAELKEKTVAYKKYEAQLNGGTEKNKILKIYLDDHKTDEGLAEVLVSFAEKKSSWVQADNYRAKAVNDSAEKTEVHKKLVADRNELADKKTEISKELFELVSSKYLLVSEILRKDLEPGKPCPVCQRIFESDEELSAHKDAVTEQAELTDEQQQAATDISDLNERLEAKQNEIIEIEKQIERIAGEIKTAEERAKQEADKKKGFIADINELLKPWAIEFDEAASEEELTTRQNQLGNLKEAYNSKKAEFEENGKKCSEAKAHMEGIDLDNLNAACQTAADVHKAAEEELAGLNEERTKLFENKSVDEVEKAFVKELREKENKAVNAEKEFQDIKDNIIQIQTAIEGYKKQKKDLDEAQGRYEAEFKGKLQKNGFTSETEFKSCLKQEDDLKALDEEIKDFANRKTAAETAYELAQKSLKDQQDKMQKAGLSTEKLEDLRTEKAELDEAIKKNNQKVGSLRQKLAQDDENKKKWDEANEKLVEAFKIKDIYDKIGNMIGVGDGADFEVFVQGIAMRSLLDQATIYLRGIIPEYRLVQKEQNSIEFHVIETMPDNTEVERDLKNFSGGEKFIISLSLALSMAEFAGQNGDVECIFLDEGFGTLSGEPLDKAIDALKKLSTTGKMLGIITHIDRVKEAFNKIEAVKSGERSILTGPGVKCTS